MDARAGIEPAHSSPKTRLLIINALGHADLFTSTKKSSNERTPEMHQTKKGNQRWFFGMKAHIGADAGSA
jgi:hypothetical protein